MSSSALQDEITSINAIYGSDTLSKLNVHSDKEGSDVCALTLPAPSVTFEIEFSKTYPDSMPLILGPTSSGSAKQGEAKSIADHGRAYLEGNFVPGDPCVFDLVEELQNRENQSIEEGPAIAVVSEHTSNDDSQTQEDNSHLFRDPGFVISEVVTEKKSVFVARAAEVSSPDEAKRCVQYLKATDKKAAKATHNMTAWRIRGEKGEFYRDCDDDGETAAGSRLLHLLELMGMWNTVVIVSRWYGGVHLGPDRFRIINSTARDAMVKLKGR
ncbi:MAG: eIF2 kinase Gcn2p negative regulator [Alyxoria varia]|nr:MAG: eIF2 kinase Gcn2p negative regulator [Alyxoria varia]